MASSPFAPDTGTSGPEHMGMGLFSEPLWHIYKIYCAFLKKKCSDCEPLERGIDFWKGKITSSQDIKPWFPCCFQLPVYEGGALMLDYKMSKCLDSF